MRDFKKLEVWQKSYTLALKIYNLTNKFPESEKFSLANQLRRASMSIGANIAEGCGRGTQKDFLRFLFNSYGSIKKCEHFLFLSRDLYYIELANYEQISEDVDILSRMLNKFIEETGKDVRRTGAQSAKPNAQS